MAEPTIRFDDGAAYEQMMGIWSRLAGEIFLQWLAPKPKLRWIDVGCGNGAFTELLVGRAAQSFRRRNHVAGAALRPDPRKGDDEMVRVVAPDGIVAAYAGRKPVAVL